MKDLDFIFNLITGNIKPEEKQKAFFAVKDDVDKEDLYKKAKITWALMSTTRKMEQYKVEESYKALHEKISSSKKQFKLTIYFRYVAVIFFIVGISVTSYYFGNQNYFSSDSGLKYTSVFAEKGQISKVILPDSSIVWLNSGTKLTYDNRYSLKNRDLTLSGQAFLEVRHNRKLPLIVTAGDLMVKVVGTRFDVCAYPDENSIHVFLESGKVELLKTGNASFKQSLNPGENAEYSSHSGKISINKAEGNYAMWKNGELIFIDSPMADVIKSLERRFDIEITVTNPNVYKSVFNANFKNESLKDILDYIQFSCPVNYQIIKQKGSDQSIVILSKK